MTPPTLGLVACAAGGIEHLRERLIQPLVTDGWTVAVTVTPTAATWLASIGETERIASLTGLPVRVSPRLPSEESPHPAVDCYAVAPATANTVAKLALGVADNQALTQVCEAIGGSVPVIVFPRVNTAHAGHPAWEGHLSALTRAKVDLVYGERVWSLYDPQTAPARELPWAEIRRRITAAISPSSD